MSGISRNWSIVVMASMAMNFFVAGLFISSWVFPENPIQRFNMEMFREKPKLGGMGRQIFERYSDDIRPRIEALREANNAVGVALRADTFVEQDLSDALNALRTATLESQAAVHDSMIKSVKEMSRVQRNKFAEESLRFIGRRKGK